MNDPQNPNPTGSPPAPPFVPKNSHGRTGKVARLPKAARDMVNQMMLDGRTYLEIIAALGEEGKDLNEDNLSSWKSGGYLEFRKEERDMAEIRCRQEYAAEVARETEGTGLCEATSKMLLAQIFGTLRDAGPGSLQTALTDKPEVYVRLLHAVARLSATAISLERQRIKEEERKAHLEKEQIPPEDRSITDQTVGVVDEMLRTH